MIYTYIYIYIYYIDMIWAAPKPARRGPDYINDNDDDNI